MKPLVALFLAQSTVVFAVAQVQPRSAPPPKFEVVSIRPCERQPQPAGGERGGGGAAPVQPIRFSADRMILQCVGTRALILWAYVEYASGQDQPAESVTGVKYPLISDRRWDSTIENGPSWLASDLYTIEAKTESQQSPEMMRGPMLQAVLEDRFKARIRRETRDAPIYALIVGKSGLKLRAAKEGSCEPWPEPMFSLLTLPATSTRPRICRGFYSFGDGVLRSFSQTMRGLAYVLSRNLDRDVMDRTGITGIYDLELDADTSIFNIGNRGAAAPGYPVGEWRRALEKLGLGLESTTGPVLQLVVDHIERPSEN